MRHLGRIRHSGLAGWQRVERVFDATFGSGLNPLRHLGALGFLCFWLLALSGIYLYAVIDTSAEGAYRSIERLAHVPWYAAGWLRSLHRYAADAFVLLMALHLAREWLHGHYQGIRRFSWLTGVPLIVFAFVSAIGGFWLNWDQLGQFSAVATAEWLDALPLLATPLARNFLTVGAVGDRLFSLFVFVHLGVALMMIFGLWFHVQRLTRAAVFPPRPLALATFAVLCVLALGAPITSHPPADAGTVPTALALDWILLFLHPLTYATSAGAVWWAVSSQPAAAAGSALPAAAGARAGGRGRCRQLQWLPALLRRLPLCRDHDGAAPERKAGQGAGARRCRPVHRLRHLRRRLPVVDAVPQRGRAGDRHRHAATDGEHLAPAPAARPGRAAGRAADRGLRLRPGRARGAAGRHGRRRLQPDLHRHAAAVLRRLRAA